MKKLSLPKLQSINLLAVVTVPFTIWLGVSGQLSWWVLSFIWIMSMSINLSIKQKRKTKYLGEVKCSISQCKETKRTGSVRDKSAVKNQLVDLRKQVRVCK